MTYTDGGSGSVAIYINGALAGSATPSAAVNTTGTQDLYIGVLQSYIGTYDFDGEVGQVRFYNSALTASEVLQNYNATVYNYINYDGIPTAVEFGIAGKTLYSARFNGSSSHISVNGSILDSRTAASYSAWVYYKGTGSGQSYGHIVSGGATNSTAGGKAFGIAVQNSNDLLYIWASNSQSSFSSTALPKNVWTHLAVTNSGGTAKMYMNGSLIHTSNPTSLAFNSSSNNLRIGEYYYNGSHHFYGEIDQVRIFNKVLSASEVSKLYGNGAGEIACEYTPTTTDINYPVTNHSYYKFDNSPADSHSGTYNGTPTNIEYAFGRYGQAAVFNGSSSQINLPTGDLSLGTNNISVSLWFNSANITQDNQSLFWFQHYQNPIRIGAVLSSTTAGMGGDNDVRFYCYSSGSLNASTDSDILNSNTWYHAVFVKSSTSGMTIYINGLSVACLLYTSPSPRDRG